MRAPIRTTSLLLAAFLTALLAGCAKRRQATEQRRQQQRVEVARKEIAQKSEAVWEESVRNKLADHLADPGGGTLEVGERTLRLTTLKLRLGSLKTPGDLQGGQLPSELMGETEGRASLEIGGVAIAAATGPEQVSGQTHEIAPDSAQIVMPDGLRWRLLGGGINFLRHEGSNVHLFIEGRAVPANQPSSPPVRVSGELVAHVELLPARGVSEAPKP